MHETDDSNACERLCLATISTIIELADDELSEVAGLALGAARGPLGSDARELLERAYGVAADAGHEYLAELCDLAISQLEPLRTT